MRVFRLVVVIAMLTGPAHAQTLIQSFDSKTPQQKADDELREKSARESAKSTPQADTTPSVDAWGNVRSTDAAKSAPAKNVAKKSKTATSAKPQSKTGTYAN